MTYNDKYRQIMMRHKKEYILELLISALKREETLSSKQMRALHLLFSNLADQLNEIGVNCTIELQGMTFSAMWTTLSFKEMVWKPIQKALYGTDSVTELTTKQINNILDVLTLSFAHTEIEVVFPNKIDLIIKQMEKLNKL